MQVAMIAQGEFMELLRAKSDEKKVIFRKLFHTEKYEKIANELGDRKRKLDAEIATIRTKFHAKAENVDIPEAFEEAEALLALKKKMQQADAKAPEMERFLELMQQLCQYLKEEGKQKKKEAKEAENCGSIAGVRCRKRKICKILYPDGRSTAGVSTPF